MHAIDTLHSQTSISLQCLQYFMLAARIEAERIMHTNAWVLVLQDCESMAAA